MTLLDLQGKKIAIVGMGINNQHLAKYLEKHKIKFDVIDGWKSPLDLVGKLDAYEIIFRTPGLAYPSLAIQQAQKQGTIVSSQTKLFFDLCPCPIVGVTGTKGKGTTSSLIFAILKSKSHVFLGGNIGTDPFEFLSQIRENDWVILELSSFQLQDLEVSPHVAVVLKITPEHLNHHKDFEEYLSAKKQIVFHQKASDVAVINYDTEETRAFAALTAGRIVWNSTIHEVKPGCYADNQKIYLDGEEVMPIDEVKLIGRFNLENVTAAIAGASSCGVKDLRLIRKVVSEFQGLEHRLEFVGDARGVKYYNDSFSTTPETAVAAISSFSQPIVLIVGGSEKKSDYSSLARAIAESQVKTLVPIGTTGLKIAKQAVAAGFSGRVADEELPTMEKIVSVADAHASPGDIVLLSPASASFDMFSDYKHRGELFKKFVKKL